jgi:putative peptide zinc metalloprotease protein
MSERDHVLLREADGLALLGEYQGSGFSEPRYMVRRADGQVIQLSRLLYLVISAIAGGPAPDAAQDAALIAGQVSDAAGREVTADNIDYLVRVKLVPLGVMAAEPAAVPAPGQPDGGEAARPGKPESAPRMSLLLSLRLRGTLLRPRAAGAVGGALAWLHYRPLVAVVLAGFAVFEAWLFVVHGAIGPVLGVLSDPGLFLAVGGLTLVSLLFHEFGHASACRHGGARPGSIGFGVYLIWPSLYTDVTDAYRLGRAGRLRTDLGGVYFNAIFVLVLAGCYAVTGQPLFLAAAFLDNFQILQQLIPLVRMDGYFIVADLAGVPDLLGLLVPIIAGQLPGDRARRAGARARGLRRGPRRLVTAWTLAAIPLLAAITGYTLWHLPSMISTAAGTFMTGLSDAGSGFTDGHPAAALAGAFTVAILVVPVAGLACLAATVLARAGSAVARQARRHPVSMRVRVAALTVTGLLIAGFVPAVAGVLSSRAPQRVSGAGPTAGQQSQRSSAPGNGLAPPVTRTPAASTPAAGSRQRTSPAPGRSAPAAASPAPAVAASASSPVAAASSVGQAAAVSGGSGQEESVSPASASAPGTSVSAHPAPVSAAPSPAQSTDPAPAPTPDSPPSPGTRPTPAATQSSSCVVQADLPPLAVGLPSLTLGLICG